MSDSNDSDPKKPTESVQGENAEHAEADSPEEPPTEQLPAADEATADEATAVLPAADRQPPPETTEFPVVAAAGAEATRRSAEEEPRAKPEATPEAIEGKPAGKAKTIALGLVVLLLLGVVGVLSGELIARRLLAICAEEAAENILHIKSDVDYDHSKFLLSSLVDHEIPYLSVKAQNGSVDKFDSNGVVQLKEAIKGLNVAAQLEDVHVTKSGGSVAHMTTQVTWTEDGIRQTLANQELKDPSQPESPITAINAVTFDPEHNQFSIDANGKIGVFFARAVVVVQPEIDKQHNLNIRIKNIDLPELHNFVGLDVSNVVNSLARPAIEQVAKRIASYPMGLKAQSAQVKSDSVDFQFYANNAPLVKGTKCTALKWFE